MQTNTPWIFIQALLPALVITQLIVVFYFLSDFSSYNTGFSNRASNNFSSPPDFSSIRKISVRKESFLRFLSPLIAEENTRILNTRTRLKTLQANFYDYSKPYSSEDSIWLTQLANEYSIKTVNTNFKKMTSALLHKIDIIPTDLAIAQAALESAWGTSRFAQDGNNFFGQWCFKVGCGIKPTNHKTDRKHYEVKKFNNAGLSVRSYIKNLNTHPAYKKLRRLRANARLQHGYVTGMSLVSGLRHYSAMGDAYADSLRNIISHNKLDKILSPTLN